MLYRLPPAAHIACHLSLRHALSSSTHRSKGPVRLFPTSIHRASLAQPHASAGPAVRNRLDDVPRKVNDAAICQVNAARGGGFIQLPQLGLQEPPT